MKAAVALEISLILYLVVGIAVMALIQGRVDPFALISLVFVVPYLLFAYFGLRAKPWAFLASSVLSAFLIVLTGATIEEGTSDLLMWETTLATLLFSLISLESFKSYFQAKGAQTSTTLSQR